MAEGRLGVVRTTSAGTSTVYTVPANSWARFNIAITSDTFPSEVRLAIDDGTGPVTAQEVIQVESLTSGKIRGVERTALVASAGERVRIITDGAGVVARVYGEGFDNDDDTHGFLARTAISTNTTTDVYTVPADKTAVVNVSVSISDNTGQGTVKLYITNDGALETEDLIHEEELDFGSRDITGFERAGVVLSEGERVQVVTTGISGNIAVRVHGHLRDEVA